MISLDLAPPAVKTMSAHCYPCKARFRIPCVSTAAVRCPKCGSGQVIDHNLAALSPEEERAAVALFLSAQ